MRRGKMTNEIKRIVRSPVFLITMFLGIALFSFLLIYYGMKAKMPTTSQAGYSLYYVNSKISSLSQTLSSLIPGSDNYLLVSNQISYYENIASLLKSGQNVFYFDDLSSFKSFYTLLIFGNPLFNEIDFLDIMTAPAIIIASVSIIVCSSSFVTNDFRIGYANLYIGNKGLKNFQKSKTVEVIMFSMFFYLIYFLPILITYFSFSNVNYYVEMSDNAGNLILYTKSNLAAYYMLTFLFNTLTLCIFSYSVSFLLKKNNLSSLLSVIFMIVLNFGDGLFISSATLIGQAKTLYLLYKAALLVLSLLLLGLFMLKRKKINYC
jgi:hypothetical protein